MAERVPEKRMDVRKPWEGSPRSEKARGDQNRRITPAAGEVVEDELVGYEVSRLDSIDEDGAADEEKTMACSEGRGEGWNGGAPVVATETHGGENPRGFLSWRGSRGRGKNRGVVEMLCGPG
jgi:hypothetical protein